MGHAESTSLFRCRSDKFAPLWCVYSAPDDFPRVFRFLRIWKDRRVTAHLSQGIHFYARWALLETVIIRPSCQPLRTAADPCVAHPLWGRRESLCIDSFLPRCVDERWMHICLAIDAWSVPIQLRIYFFHGRACWRFAFGRRS